MSQENVEVIRRAYEAFGRGDIDGVVADFAPDSEYVASGVIPGVGGVYGGPDGYRRFLDGFLSEFSDLRVEAYELIDAGDQVFASTTLWGRGKQSGAETSWSFWQAWTVRDGIVVRGRGFPSEAEALEAVGLSE